MKNSKLASLLCLAFAVVCFHVSVWGQSLEDKNRLAAIRSHGLSVTWEVVAPYSLLTLTVSAPDGQVFRREFRAGKSPEFTITDKLGERLPDGDYTYELRLTPVFSNGVKEKLSAARAKGDDEEVERVMRKRGILPTQPLVQSGGFSILNGSIIVGGAIEETDRGPAAKNAEKPQLQKTARGGAVIKLAYHPIPVATRYPTPVAARYAIPTAVRDFVIADDLIVQGSACVGLDCVNGEAFGFDTIRMKENNTRLQFDDTSVSAGFATNNWQIRANAQGSGGGSFLGFVDQGATGNSETGTIVFEVDAGAPANSLRVSSFGRIGLRTATPVLDVHANTSNTPAIRLEQNNAGGFTAQTWDMAGNEANFFVRDVTHGSLLPFRIRPGAPTSSIDIAADGDVGIGTASPDTRLSVVGAGTSLPTTYNPGDVATFVTPTDGFTNIALVRGGIVNPQGLHFGVNQASLFSEIQASRDGVTTNTLVLNRQGGNVGIGTSAPSDLLSVNGNASKPGGGSWSVFSDERLKTIKGKFSSGLKAIMQLHPLRYEYRKDNALGIKSEGEHVGFGAEAVQRVIPEAVTRSDQGYLHINNDPILWTMLNAIKEQQAEITRLKRQIRRLETSQRRRR